MKHHYDVTKDGRVYSHKTNRFLRPANNGKGYQHVVLRIGGKSVDKYIHRLVAEAHLPNPHRLPEVNHKDGDKANNCVDNLEWVTSSENKIHAATILCSQLKPIQLKKGGVGYWWPSHKACKEDTGLRQQNISGLYTGYRKKIKGWVKDE